MPYHLSRAAALDIATYLSTYQSDSDHSSEVSAALFALVNGDEESIVLADDMRVVRDLKPGDRVDLEGDRYADPNHDNPALDCEYALVGAVIVETPECIVLCFDGFDRVGFPPDHMLPYGGHDDKYTEES